MLFELINKLKHLAGQHEQKTHAGKGIGSVKPGVDESSEMYKKSVKLVKDANDCCYSEPGTVADDVVNKISKRSGVSRNEVKNFIEEWNRGTFESEDEHVSINRAISAEMGVPLSDYQYSKYATFRRTEKTKSDKQKKIVRAIYDETQEELSKRGITEVPLYRGTIKPKGETKFGSDSKHRMNSAESWTTDKGTTEFFSENFGGDDFDGMTISATIPASRIFSTSISGVGTTSEFEFIVLGSKIPDDVSVEERII